MRKLILFLVLIAFLPATAMALPVSVYFEPISSDVILNDTFSVAIKADIPDPILGWGLDLSYDTSVLTLNSLTIGPGWGASPGGDGDFLAALAFPLTTPGTGITLATLDFSADAIGSANLSLSTTPGDLTEGFALLIPGQFAEINFSTGSVSVSDPGATAPVPEPGTMILFGTGLIGLAGFSRRKKKM